MSSKKNITILFINVLVCISSLAQSPYVLNGTAMQDSCQCYTLTSTSTFESGSIWNKNQINLNQPFDYFFNVFLGCSDSLGADGLTFVLQPDSTGLGNDGAGMGFQGIITSLGITIDTYENIEQNDPPYDHITLQANGDTYHNSVNNLAGPVSALANSNNIEDCKWHILHVSWQPADSLITVSLDGFLRLSLQKDIIHTIFNDAPVVYWGFTAATGGAANVQKICTATNAAFYLAPHSNSCIGTAFKFVDSSLPFGNTTNWYWNFGDNSTSNQQNPPSHLYSSAGVYNITLNIRGSDGCLSDTFKQPLTVGSLPKADFKTDYTSFCENRSVFFYDATTLQVGTESYWYWDFRNGITSTEKNPPAQSYTAGSYPVKFFVETAEGCTSDTVEKIIAVKKTTSVNFTKSDGCKNVPVLFAGEKPDDTINIKQWYFNFGDAGFSNNQTAYHTYTNGGIYNVQLFAVTDNGCVTDTFSKPVQIYATDAYAGNDTTVLINNPYQLNASGGDSYTWSPSAGLNNPFIANPVATLNNDATYILTASTVLGCETKDTLHIKVEKSPEIYVPSAFTPNGDGKNDRFKIVPVGITELIAFKIYNRWGQLLYSSLNASNGWDGYFNGILQISGTYIWLASGKTIDGRLIKKQGTLVLIR